MIEVFQCVVIVPEFTLQDSHVEMGLWRVRVNVHGFLEGRFGQPELLKLYMRSCAQDESLDVIGVDIKYFSNR